VYTPKEAGQLGLSFSQSLSRKAGLNGDPGEELQTEKAESRHAGILPYFFNSLSKASFCRS
jgi:hypothetical protein